MQSDSFSSPCIWTRNSVLMRRAASLSFSFLEPHSESTSSMKMIEGLCWRARSNRFFTSLGNAGRDGQNETTHSQTHSVTLLYCNILPNSSNIPCLSFSRIQAFQTNTHTSHSLPATWTWGLRRRQRRRWSCWPRWPRPWPGMTSQSLEDQTAGCLSTESACLKTQRPRSNVGQTELVFNSLF